MVLPELFAFDLAAVAANPAEAAEFSRTIRERVQQLTTEHDVHVAYSAIEGMGSEFRHSGFLIGPKGRVLGEYHQVHLTRSMARWAAPGEEFQVWNTPIGRMGMMLGYDGVFPETATALARMGADVILYPTSWRLDWEVEKGLLERAAENHVSVVSCTRWDSPVHRGSLIIPATKTPRRFDGDLNPVRPVEVPPGYETWVTVSIDPGRSRSKVISLNTDLLASRKPELYQSLVTTAG
jgi:predicted amidohydrolase